MYQKYFRFLDILHQRFFSSGKIMINIIMMNMIW